MGDYPTKTRKGFLEKYFYETTEFKRGFSTTITANNYNNLDLKLMLILIIPKLKLFIMMMELYLD